MGLSVNETKIFRNMMNAIILTVALLLAVAPSMALAKRGGDEDTRTEFYGIVQVRPENVLQGEWVIGGRTFITDGETEFDQSEGNLAVGSCAKVQLRNGRVHEIDSEPMRDCQWNWGTPFCACQYPHDYMRTHRGSHLKY